MPHSWHLGNDVVDLADPRHTGKAGDDRFLRRVFSDKERAAIRESPNPDRALWIAWAGKEAAFKTLSKSLGSPPTFIHASFEVEVPGMGEEFYRPIEGHDPPVSRFGQVGYGARSFPLRIEVAGSTLHAVTWTPPFEGAVPSFFWGFETFQTTPDPWRENLRPWFSTREWSCISHRASALARLGARRVMAKALTLEEEQLEITCGPGRPGQRIPFVLYRGQEVGVDLTLSHHGRMLAWAFLLSTAPRHHPSPDYSQGR
jgi:phosphopantetheinyl transferase (holo-ACP synthase)